VCALGGDRWHPVALGTRFHGAKRSSAASGCTRGAAQWQSVTCSLWWHAIVPLVGARAVLMSVGGIWHSAALGSTRRRAVARIVALGGALQRTVAISGTRWNAVAGGRWHRAVTPLGGARWRADVCTLWHSVASGGARRRWLARPFRRISKIGWLGSCSAPARISVRSVLAGMARSAAHSGGARWCSVVLENWAPLMQKLTLGVARRPRCLSVPRTVERVGRGGVCTRWPRPRNSMMRGGARQHPAARAV
jgi:hypothetical protein